MTTFIALNLLCVFVALLLDHVIGDPRTSWHPVCLLGRLNRRLEHRLYPLGFSGGALLTLLSTTVAVATTLILLWAAIRIHVALYLVVNTLIIFFAVSARSMVQHALAVHAPLVTGDLEGARRALAMIVSRDTAGMDQAMVIRSTVESVAENFTDGVLSPVVFAALGGAAGAMLFKAVSTLDSMVGYRNVRYEQFGKFAARADDVLNFIPARLALVLIPAAAFGSRLNPGNAWRIGRRFRLAHASPNSAHSMAAFAGALDTSLGGAATYFGIRKEKPCIGDGARIDETALITDATGLFTRTTALLALCAAILYLTLLIVMRYPCA
ncbi:adenosylcobinamide-phosphate synthase CbiB [Pelovirga terrestris]|uniref:Cobalamin biosynthesis protein CobD n=1 Tax=Pelovirga terrestris TaxID=2771352 RepID=A0A8J6UGI9_9BACT|nr:adenosylcobinamide-phosphate synthase CbiB [Pelovirga terrestris]MBD1399838.1 cobalamin biosynthesis protein CobD [Pelovirga terrestris]